MNRSMGIILNGALVGAAAVLLALAERFLDGYSIQILNLVAINILLALSLNLIYGFTGMFSLGHAGFMAIGAYVCAILILTPDQKATLFLLEPAYPWIEAAHAPFLVAVTAGGLAAAAAAALVGIPLLRLGDDYLGIATLGFAEIVRVLATNLPRITNGALGFKGIPAHANLWWNYGWCLLGLVVMVRLLASPTGHCLKAIRDDEIAARAMGVDAFRLKVLSFTLGAFFAGVGGGLLASLLTTIDPKMFLFTMTFNVLMMVVMGGLGSVTGSVIAGAAVTVILEWLRFVENPITLGSLTLPGIPGMRMVVFSLLLIAVILFRREGLMGTREITWERLAAWVRRRRTA